MSLKGVGVFAIVYAVVVSTSFGDSWPGWRGADGNGRSAETNLPLRWSVGADGAGVLWKMPVAGVGHASPIVWNDRIFITTATSSDPKLETFKPGLYFGGNQKKPDAAEYSYRLICLDAKTGKTLWSKAAIKKYPSIPRHIKNSYASETPVTDGRHVYASFGPEGLFCFDFDGNVKWKRSLGTFRMRYGWGTSSSPILYKDKVIVVCDRQDDSYIAAFDKETGEPVWRSSRDEKSNWATPFVFDADGRDLLIANATGRMKAYDPLTGKTIWECAGGSSIVSPTPVSGHGLVYVTSGYVGDQNRPIYAVRPGATGDLTLGEGEKASDGIAWYLPQAGPYIPSPVVYGPYLYVLLDRGFLTCYDAKTGKEVYGKQRLGRRNAFTASPVAGDGKIYCLSEEGTCYVIKAGPEFKVLAVNELEEVCMASPAIANGKLYVRARKHLYCIGKP